MVMINLKFDNSKNFLNGENVNFTDSEKFLVREIITNIFSGDFSFKSFKDLTTYKGNNYKDEKTRFANDFAFYICHILKNPILNYQTKKFFENKIKIADVLAVVQKITDFEFMIFEASKIRQERKTKKAKLSKSEIMKEAHKLAKTFTGNYSACLSLALKEIYKIEKAK